MNVDWKDCDPTLDNFMKNVVTLDALRNLPMMSSVLHAYYNLTEDKSTSDLESMLREFEVNVGLIAVDLQDANALSKR